MGKDEAQFPKETDARGAWVRQASAFRERVTADGSSGYPAEAGRYHLYVSYACPWASRTLMVRRLKRLEAAIPVAVVDPIRDERGWRFSSARGCTPPATVGIEWLRDAYLATRPDFEGRVTVPVLWDTRSGRIVNNESAEIIRMLNDAFDAFGDGSLDLYPPALRAEIDAVNQQVYEDVNDGVYRCGFAASQEAYDAAFDRLFARLDALEARLAGQRYLAGERLTEADIRLFTTLVRFDPVYYVHFKCNLHQLVDYPHLWAYTRELYQMPGMAETVDMDHIKRHYYITHRRLNPSGIVPKGPELDLEAPHGREHLRG